MDLTQFLDVLDALDEAELNRLCRQFALSYDAFPGGSKRDKARAFVGYMHRQGRLAGLAEATVAMRPDLTPAVAALFAADEASLAWLDQMGAGGGTMSSGVTWRWPSDRVDRGVAKADAGPSQDEPPLPASSPVAQEISTNPYAPGRAVHDAAMFFGRDEERAQALRRLLAGEHVAIAGPRRMGGSSLLYRLAQDAGGDGRLPAYVDLKEPALRRLPSLLNYIWRQWWTAVRPGDAPPVRTLGEFVTAARKLTAAGFRPLLFLDELEQLTWRPDAFDDALLDAWLELGREGALTFAIAVHASPVDLLAQGGFQSRFYELFGQLDLGLLSPDASRALLTEPASRAGLSVPEGAAEHLLALAGPHPFFLHMAGHYLYDAVARAAYSRDQVSAHFRAAAEPFWQELWDELSPLAQRSYPPASIDAAGLAERQWRILARRGLLVPGESGYRPFSDGFAEWLRRQRAATEAIRQASA